MDVSAGFLFLGFGLTLIGAAMVYLSLRARPGEAKGAGVVFIGPIPIIVVGSRRWIVAALTVAAIVMIFIMTKSMYPDLIGW